MSQNCLLRSLFSLTASGALLLACSSDGDDTENQSETGDEMDSQGGTGDGDTGSNSGDGGGDSTGDGDGDGSGGPGDGLGGAGSGGEDSMGGAGLGSGGMEMGSGGTEMGSGGMEMGSGGMDAVDTFRLDMNFYQSATCSGSPGYVMGADYDSGACYTGIEVKARVRAATPGLAAPAENLLNQVFSDGGFFSFACNGTSPTFTRYSDAACMTALGSTNPDACAFVMNTGQFDVYAQQTCSRP